MLLVQETYQSFGKCRVNLDGLKVWTTDPGGQGWIDRGHTGSIHIYDAYTGALKDTIPVFGYHPDSTMAVKPAKIRFLPNSEKVYITSDGGPILAINSRTKSVERVIFYGSNKYSVDIDLVPQP